MADTYITRRWDPEKKAYFVVAQPVEIGGLGGGDGADLSAAVVLAPDASTRNLIQPTGPAVIAFVLKAAASQSANILEIHNSAGVVLAKLNPNGAWQTQYGYGSLDGTISLGFGAGATVGQMIVFNPAGTLIGFKLNTSGAGVELRSPDGGKRAIVSLNNDGHFRLGPSGALTPGLSFADGTDLYVEGGALKYRGSSGTVTQLAPA